jgi:hypothetical protein
MAAAREDDRYAEYRDEIRRRVCSVCLDSRDDGSCGLSARTCAIDNHLPNLVKAVLETESPRLDEYVDALRQEVCSRCREQKADGTCALRDRAECGLDAYLSLVVDAIEDVRARRGE